MWRFQLCLTSPHGRLLETGSIWLSPVDEALSGVVGENQVTAVSWGAALHLTGSSPRAVGLVGCGPALSIDSVHPFVGCLSVHVPDVEIWRGWSVAFPAAVLSWSVVRQSVGFGQFSLHAPLLRCCSVTKSCLTLCDPMNRSTPGFTVHHQLPELTQTHVRWVGDAIQPSHPPSSPSPSAFNLSPASGSFPMSQLFASGGQSTGVSASASVLPMSIQDWFPLGSVRIRLGWSPCSPRDSQKVFSPAPWFESISLLHGPALTSIHDLGENHSIECTDLCQQSPNPFVCLSFPVFLCPHRCCLGAPRFLQTQQTHLQMCVLTCARVFDLKTGQERGAAEGEAVGPGQAVPTEQTPVWPKRLPERVALRQGSCCPQVFICR